MKGSSNDALRQRAFALACIVAWFVMSNHCALVGMMSRHALSSGCPHCAGTENQGAPVAPLGECCRHLKIRKEVVPPFTPLPQVAERLTYRNFYFSGLTKVPYQLSRSGEGPPGFVEIVLHRSLQAHAPPLLLSS